MAEENKEEKEKNEGLACLSLVSHWTDFEAAILSLFLFIRARKRCGGDEATSGAGSALVPMAVADRALGCPTGSVRARGPRLHSRRDQPNIT